MLVADAYERIRLDLVFLQGIALDEAVIPGFEFLVALFRGSRVDEYACVGACLER
jgi:hypothetical protein